MSTNNPETKLSIKTEDIFYRWNEHYKVIEAVDSVSGKVVALQEDYNEEHLLNPENMIQVTLDGGDILIQKGMSVSGYIAPRLNYSKPVADIVLQRVSDGATLKEALKGINIKVSTVLSWCDKIPSFGEALAKARLYRAESIQDTILETAREMHEGVMSKAELEGKGKAVDILKWALEKDSPNRFGSKKESSGTSATIINALGNIRRLLVNMNIYRRVMPKSIFIFGITQVFNYLSGNGLIIKFLGTSYLTRHHHMVFSY